MKKSVGSFALNRRGILLLGVVLSLAVFAIATWRTSAQHGREPAAHEAQQGDIDSNNEVPAAPDGLTRLRDGEAYGRVPLSFEANRGQTDPQVQFIARSPGYTVFLTSTEAVFSLQRRNQKTPGGEDTPIKRAKADVLRMKLVGGNPASQAEGCDQLPGKSNYFIGKERENWQVNVPTFATVHYQNIYNGVDLVYYGNEQQLEYDFVVAPGADPKLITLAFDGAKKITIDGDGKLLLRTGHGQMKLQKPVIYQVVDGVRHEVAGRYAMRNRRHVGFEVADYDHKQPLVIDPVLTYSTYLGGSQVDEGHGIATDSAGNTYVTGSTESLDFPTANAAQSTYGGNTDAFITKLNPSGTALVYSTYIGDFFAQSGRAIAVDASGSAYATGESRIGSGAVNARDVLIVKLGPTGAVVYSGTFGGSSGDVGNGIAVDSAGNAYITGDSDSTDFPTTASAFQTGTEFPAGQAFVTKVNPDGTSLLYSTMLGGSGGSRGIAAAADAAGNVYVTGGTASNDFLISPNAFQKTRGGSFSDAYVAKLNTNGSGLASLVYSTYLGGDDSDRGNGIAVDSAGNAYVAGYTGQSSTFPTTPGAFRQKVAPFRCSREFGMDKFLCEDAFVTKINPTGTGLVYSTLLGGGADERGLALALDGAGNTYVTGTTNTPSGTSLAYPTTSDAFQPAFGGFVDAFVTELNSTGTALVSSSYLGGSGNDEGRSIAVDSSRNTYVVGNTASTNFPTTANAVQKIYGGPSNSFLNGDAFVAKIGSAGGPTPTPTPTPTPGGSISGAVIYGTTPIGQPAKFVPGVLLTAAGSVAVNATTNSLGAYLLSGFGSGAYTVTPSKSGDVNGISALDAALVAQHAAGLIVLTSNQQLAGDATNNGTLSALDASRIAQTAAGITNPGIAGQWKFLPATRSYPSVSSSISNENYEAVLVGDVTGNWTPPAARTIGDKESAIWNIVDPVDWDSLFGKRSGKPDVVDVYLPVDARGAPGGVVTVPISIGDTTGKGVLAFEFTLNFDPNVLSPTLDPASTAGTLSEGWSITVNSEIPGRITVTAYSIEELVGEGTLLNLNFTVIGPTGTSMPLKWTRFELNENEIPSTLKPGLDSY